jgi:hypothetical protein
MITGDNPLHMMRSWRVAQEWALQMDAEKALNF